MSLHFSYGNWSSVISAADVAEQNIQRSEPKVYQHKYFWLEARPAEGGRYQLVSLDDKGKQSDLLSPGFSVHNNVNEYGGGSYCLGSENIYFVNQHDQQIYQLPLSHQSIASPQALTKSYHCRFADLQYDPRNGHIIAICEDHHHSLPNPPQHSLVSIATDGKVVTIATGADFYSSPRLFATTNQLAWISWDHPNMPWDCTELHLATIDRQGNLSQQKTLINQVAAEAVMQPTWSPDGELYCLSDRSNWWNIYRYQPTTNGWLAICPMEAEFGTPPWQLGDRHFTFMNETQILACCTQKGYAQLLCIDTKQCSGRKINNPYVSIEAIHSDGYRTVLLATSTTVGNQLLSYENQQLVSLPNNPQPKWSSTLISEAKHIEFGEGDKHCYGFYYPPHNPDVEPPTDELPPLLVFCHGGPTAMSNAGINLKIQYWTSRGFSVVDVNYRGSSGYGRNFRHRLDGQWGIVDVDDCCRAAQYLCKQGLVDATKLFIRGGSAGGYTTLCALAFRDEFAGGCSLYGISDLEKLARDTHKFEAYYLQKLVATYPQHKAIYEQRSPIHFVHQIQSPLLILQGLKDKVVPPNQAEVMVTALEANKIPYAYLTFAEEGHGFRNAETIKETLHNEWLFYKSILGLLPAESTQELHIHNVMETPCKGDELKHTDEH